MIDTTELRQFGEGEDSLDGRFAPSIEQGGFIVPGRFTAIRNTRGKEQRSDGGADEGPQEARPAAGSRAGQRAPAAAQGAPAHAVERGLAGQLGLDELFDFYPGAREVDSSPAFSYLVIPVGLFRSMPYRATLLLEVPRTWAIASDLLVRDGRPAAVPTVRAWATWADGLRVRSHHRYPDGSICACRPGEWVWGRDPLHEYADWCVCWIGRSLHLMLLGRWPGRQHYPAHVRVQRNRPDEYCGCGSDRFWRFCCMEKDLEGSVYRRFMGVLSSERRYTSDLAFQGRVPGVQASAAGVP